MGLEIQTGKTPGAEVRRTPAERPAFIGLLIVGLMLIIWLMFYLVVSALLPRLWIGNIGVPDDQLPPMANNAAEHDPAIPNLSFSIFGFKEVTFFLNEQTIISFWISIIFFSLTYMIFLYQRFFRDHVTIYKKRFRKWEDEGVQLHD
jgi:ABC-type multidrug transport system fused ATPase/permease subunit